MNATKKTTVLDPRNILVPEYQRGHDARRVDLIFKAYNKDALGAVTVVKRPDGRHYIIDGNHRRLASIKASNYAILAIEYEGLSLAQESALFLELNSTKQVSAVDRFKAAVIAGDEKSIEINTAVTEAGWKVSAGNGMGEISAVVALTSIYDGLRIVGQNRRISIVRATLGVITTAWGHENNGVNAGILKGVAKVLMRYEGSVDRAELSKRLRKIDPVSLLSKGRAAADALNVTVDTGVARTIVGLYNARRQSGQIHEWVWSR